MKHIIDELEKLPKYWSSVHKCYMVRVEDVSASIASSPQADGMVLALSNTELKKRIAVLEDLLSSAYNIANRNGEHTHWERFAGQLHVNGISPVTAKTFKILPSDTELSAYKPQADDVRNAESIKDETLRVCAKYPISYPKQSDDVRKDAERFRRIAENKLGVHFENNTVLGEIVEVYSNYDEDGNCQCDTERTANAPIDALRLDIDKARE